MTVTEKRLATNALQYEHRDNIINRICLIVTLLQKVRFWIYFWLPNYL